MQAYVEMVKKVYKSGQDYLAAQPVGKGKAAAVKIDKAETIENTKNFNNAQLDIPACITTLSHLIYLMNQGETFYGEEISQIFFSVTRLLQTDDESLKRMIYIMIKEMKNESSIYIVTSSLMKDIHNENPNFRRNSLRTIPSVLFSTPTNISQI